MDFTKFDSIAAADKGTALHIKDPATLAPLFDNPDNPHKDNGKPCRVILLGAESPKVREAFREIQKARAKGDDADKALEDEETVSMDELHERLVEIVLPRVVGFENVHRGEKEATKRDAAWFFGLNRMNGQEGEQSFVEQAADHSSSRKNYLGNA